MHVTMIKKRLLDGSECRKCVEASEHLKTRGLQDRIDEVVWAEERDPESSGMVLAAKHGVSAAPFFIVRDAGREEIYTSVLQLIRERLGQTVTAAQHAASIDVDDVGICRLWAPGDGRWAALQAFGAGRPASAVGGEPAGNEWRPSSHGLRRATRRRHPPRPGATLTRVGHTLARAATPISLDRASDFHAPKSAGAELGNSCGASGNARCALVTR